MKQRRISVYASDEQHEAISEQARKANLSISAYLIKCAIGEIFQDDSARPSANYGKLGHKSDENEQE